MKKALSIKQPWASLIAHGIKDIENRTWQTHFRGKIYIHSSAQQIKTKDISFPSNEVWLNNVPDYMRKTAFFNKNITSAIIGEVEIIDCVQGHKSVWAEKSRDGEKPIWNWVLSNPVLYDRPILNVKGKLSFWQPEENEKCMNCDKKYFGNEPQFCCNGKDCGCMGLPTEPYLCDDCYKNFKR